MSNIDPASVAEISFLLQHMFRVETARHLTSRYADTIAGRFFDPTGALLDRNALPARSRLLSSFKLRSGRSH